MSNDKYIEIIKKQAATPTEINPVTKIINNREENSSLFRVTQFGKTFIYKISDRNTSFRNLMLAQYLLSNGVPVPDSKIFVSGGVNFERYEQIPGITLSTFLARKMWGTSQSFIESQTQRILREVLAYDKKISKISPKNENIKKQLVLCERRKHHHTKDFGKLIADIDYAINKKQTEYGTVALHHVDLNPSNILLDEHGKFKAILDLDSLALCDEYTMLAQILMSWPNLSIDEVVEIYKSVFYRDINTRHLKNLLIYKKIRNKTATVLRQIRNKNR